MSFYIHAGPPKQITPQALSIVAEAAMHVEQEQERRMQLQKQQQLEQQLQQQRQEQHQQHVAQNVVLVEQRTQLQQSNTQADTSDVKPLSHQFVPREVIVHEPSKMQTVQIIKRPGDYPQSHQQQYSNQTIASATPIEEKNVRYIDQAGNIPTQNTSPVKFIAQNSTKSLVQGLKILQNEQSVQQVHIGEERLPVDANSTSRAAIPLYVAMQSNGSTQQNQPKLVPVTVVAKPQTQLRQEKQVSYDGSHYLMQTEMGHGDFKRYSFMSIIIYRTCLNRFTRIAKGN